MPGVWLKNTFETLIGRLAEFAGGEIDSPIVRSLVCDGLIGGAGSVLSFIPQIALMYLFLDFLEESGFMSALAFMTDGLFSKIGLSGRAAFRCFSATAVRPRQSLPRAHWRKKAFRNGPFPVSISCRAARSCPCISRSFPPCLKTPFWAPYCCMCWGREWGWPSRRF
ncbi:MAG: nucleoside recognition domain-containing protein [Christensenellaceae bacterium]